MSKRTQTHQRTTNLLLAITAILLAITAIPLTNAITVDELAVTPADPVTTSTLVCLLRVTGTGTLEANITWYRNGVLWGFDTETLALTSGVNATTGVAGSIEPANTTRGQTWRCEATIGNGTDTLAANSSVTTIQNSLPTLLTPTSPQVVPEDSPVSLTATAFDADGDSIITYISSDLNASLYNNTQLFTIQSNGSISFTPLNTAIGNHTVAILAYDGAGWGGANVLFTVTEVNDAPAITNPGDQQAIVGEAFNLSIIATDEENNNLTFSLGTNSSGLILTQVTPFTARLTFGGTNGAPLPGDVGFFQVNITAIETLNASSNNTITFTVNVTEPNIQPNFTNISNASGTQGLPFEYTITANDSNPTDTLIFSITSPGCLTTSPWSINTTQNGSTNATGVINTTLTNAHIACRNVTITVSDYAPGGALRSSVSTTVLFNLTNTNDAPVIGEISPYANYLGQQNLSNLSAAVGVPFSYRVNGSDPDQLTYQGDTITFSDNTSLFAINGASGQITFTPGPSDVGTHLINITATDTGGLNGSRTMNLTITSNTAPTPISPGTVTCQEDSECTYNLTATDPDGGDNVTFTVNDTIITNLEQLTTLITRTNHTYTNNQVGNYTILLTATDRWGASNTTNFTLVINNTNDAPFFDSNKDNLSDALTLPGPVVIGIEKTWTVIASDLDFRNVAENLTFTATIDGPNPALFTINKTAEDRATITFTPGPGDGGSYNVTVNVTDTAGATASANASFTIISPGLLPDITGAQPYYDGIVQTNTSITPTVAIATSVNFRENETASFNITFTDGDTTAGAMTVRYYWNSVSVYNTTGSNPNYTRYLDFFSAGTHELRVEIEDDTLGTDEFTWDITITNVKRIPVVTGTFPDRVINGTTILVDEMRFLDPDDDLNSNGVLDANETNTLVFTPVETAYFDASYSGRTAFITPVADGIITFQYAATTAGNEYAIGGNSVTYIVFTTQQESQSSSSSSSGGGGGGGGGGGAVAVPRPQPFPDPFTIDLIVPEAVTIYDNGTVIAPISIVNTGEILLSDITLSAETDAEVEMQFLANSIRELAPGAAFNTSLAIRGYRLGGTFEVVVIAEVGEPSFNDTAKFFINSLERGSSGDAVNTKITSARDFLTQNPVCGELTQLVDQARSAYNRGALDEAEELLTAVTDGCSYLKAIQAQELQDPGLLGILGKRSTTVILGGALLGLLALGAMLVTHYARQE